MVTVRSLRLDRLLRIVGRALQGNGALARDPAIHYRPDVPGLVVEGLDGRPFPYQVDGDFLGEITRLELRHVPDILDLVVPVDDDPPPERTDSGPGTRRDERRSEGGRER